MFNHVVPQPWSLSSIVNGLAHWLNALAGYNPDLLKTSKYTSSHLQIIPNKNILSTLLQYIVYVVYFILYSHLYLLKCKLDVELDRNTISTKHIALKAHALCSHLYHHPVQMWQNLIEFVFAQELLLYYAFVWQLYEYVLSPPQITSPEITWLIPSLVLKLKNTDY